ncbi:MAG TPA: hypothetical protein PK812_11150 [Beijerinckiaceae bacterium]|nr:hypothetical protein [Beijerinckiaceae bacterium]
MWQAIIGPKPVWYWIVTALVGLAALGMYLVNDRERKDIRWSIAGLPSGAGASGTGYGEPELWVPPRYDAAQLNAFKKKAGDAPLRSYTLGRAGQKSALQHYVRPVLIYNDISYAVLLGGFAFLVNLGLAGLWPRPMAGIAALWALCALVYAIADIREDQALASMFAQPSAITEEQAATARNWSSIKYWAALASVSGGLSHLAFGVVGSVVNGPDPK